MDRFRSRATADELRQFTEFTASTHPEQEDRALEMVLFKLNGDELFELGITQTDQEDGPDWAVAWALDNPGASNAIGGALERVDVPCLGSCGHGFAGWYVQREQFFTARRALLESPDVQSQDIQVVTPKFSLK